MPAYVCRYCESQEAGACYLVFEGEVEVQPRFCPLGIVKLAPWREI
jgi:hypothetical protein